MSNVALEDYYALIMGLMTLLSEANLYVPAPCNSHFILQNDCLTTSFLSCPTWPTACSIAVSIIEEKLMCNGPSKLIQHVEIACYVQQVNSTIIYGLVSGVINSP